MEAQLRTRRKAQEAQDYLDDLLKWQEVQQKKDEYLRRKGKASNAASVSQPCDASDRHAESDVIRCIFQIRLLLVFVGKYFRC